MPRRKISTILFEEEIKTDSEAWMIVIGKNSRENDNEEQFSCPDRVHFPD